MNWNKWVSMKRNENPEMFGFLKSFKDARYKDHGPFLDWLEEYSRYVAKETFEWIVRTQRWPEKARSGFFWSMHKLSWFDSGFTISKACIPNFFNINSRHPYTVGCSIKVSTVAGALGLLLWRAEDLDLDTDMLPEIPL